MTKGKDLRAISNGLVSRISICLAKSHPTLFSVEHRSPLRRIFLLGIVSSMFLFRRRYPFHSVLCRQVLSDENLGMECKYRL